MWSGDIRIGLSRTEQPRVLELALLPWADLRGALGAPNFPFLYPKMMPAVDHCRPRYVVYMSIAYSKEKSMAGLIRKAFLKTGGNFSYRRPQNVGEDINPQDQCLADDWQINAL